MCFKNGEKVNMKKYGEKVNMKKMNMNNLKTAQFPVFCYSPHRKKN